MLGLIDGLNDGEMLGLKLGLIDGLSEGDRLGLMEGLSDGLRLSSTTVRTPATEAMVFPKIVAAATVKVAFSAVSQRTASPVTTTVATPSTKVKVVLSMVAVPKPLVSAMETPEAMARLNHVWISPSAVWSSM